MTDVLNLLPRFQQLVADFDQQITMMEEGDIRVLRSNVNVTAEALAQTRQSRESLQKIIDAITPT